MLYRLLTLGFVLSGLMAAGMVDARTIPVDGIAARVNKRVITVGEIILAMQSAERQLRTQYAGRELVTRLEQAYDRTLQALIEQALILEEFDRQEGSIPPQVVDEHIQSIISDSFRGDRGELLQQLAREGMTMEEWRQTLQDQIAVMQLRRQEVLPKLVVSPRQVREAYEQRRDTFRIPAQVHVRMIVLPTADDDNEALRAQMEELLERLRGGADFDELARTYSQDTRAARGGDWGWIEPSILRTELREVVESLEPGGISRILDTDEAFYLVKLEDRKSAGMRAFADVQDDLTEEIRREEEERIYRSWINRLKNQFFVKLYDRQDSELDF